MQILEFAACGGTPCPSWYCSVPSSARSVIPIRTGIWCLESGYCPWFPGLAYSVNSLSRNAMSISQVSQDIETYLSNPRGDWQVFQVRVRGNQESREHCRDQEIQHPMRLVQNDCEHIIVMSNNKREQR